MTEAILLGIPAAIALAIVFNRSIDEYYANMPYRQYLKSRRWQKKRKNRLKIDRYNCKRCGSPHHLQIHHLTYKRRGHERMGDLITLCDTCHRLEHGIAD